MALVLNSRQFAQYHKHLAERFIPTIKLGVQLGVQRAIPYLVQRTRTAIPANPQGVGTGGAFDTGGYARSWKAVSTADGAAIMNTHRAAMVIEHGRRPGSKFPPREDLVPWIMRKLVSKPKEKKRRFGPKLTVEQARSVQEAKRLEAAIARVAARDPKAGRRKPKVAGPRKPTSTKASPTKPPSVRKPKRILSAREQAERLYFPVARAIARRGLVGRKILTAPEAQDEILALVNRSVTEELRKVTSKL